MPGRDLVIDLGKVAPATDREAIEIASLDVVLARLIECAGPLEQPSQAEVDLGEIRVLGQKRPIDCLALHRILVLGRPGLLELFGQRGTFSLRDTSGKHGAVGFKPRFVSGRNDQDRHPPDLLAIGNDGLEPSPKTAAYLN